MDEGDGPIWERLNKLEVRLYETEKEVTNELTKLNAKLGQLVDLAQNYVTKERFQMVQVIVYGFAAIILTSVIGALLAKVIAK